MSLTTRGFSVSSARLPVPRDSDYHLFFLCSPSYGGQVGTFPSVRIGQWYIIKPTMTEIPGFLAILGCYLGKWYIIFLLEKIILDGNLNIDELPDPDYHFKSSLKVDHKIRRLFYIISMEEGIELSQYPSFKLIPEGQGGKEKELICFDNSDLFYRRFLVVLKSPVIGSKVKANWMVRR